MALKARLESAEAEKLSEEIAREYAKQEDGTFVLQVDAVGGLELADTGGLKKALGVERAAGKAAQQKLLKFADLDPEAAAEALAKVAEMADWNPEKEVAEKVKAREAQLIKRHEDEKSRLLKAQEDIEAQLEKHLITTVLMKSITDAGGIPKMLVPYLRGRVRMRKDAGNFFAEVIGEDGTPSIGDSAGNPTTMDQLVEETKADSDWAGAFKGTGSSGSGAGETPTGGTAPPAGGGGGGKKTTIAASDEDAMRANFDKIAAGDVQVDTTR